VRVFERRHVAFSLLAHQADVLDELKNGSVLVGQVGSGKSITALEYDKKIVVITTAKKRDSGEWFSDAMLMSLRQELEVDSWNNIGNYVGYDAFFIFDEQRIVGKGAWVDHYLKIARANPWILLSATPADVWMDLRPVFIAHGFYRNITDFNEQHVVWNPFVRFPQVKRYVDEHILEKYRDQIYVEMVDLRHTVRHEHVHYVQYDKEEERLLHQERWNFWENVPVKDAGDLMRLMRKSVNSHPSRYEKCKELAENHDRVIIFYNHNYELEILRGLAELSDFEIAEWNGHKHQAVPGGERWVYLVQFTAGAEGWNCTTTNHTVIYSLPYSYRVLEQGKGRTDRINTPFTDLHYHILKSHSIFDRGIDRSLRKKKNFQASAFGKKIWEKSEKPVFTRLN
jgi:hypothetical protein